MNSPRDAAVAALLSGETTPAEVAVRLGVPASEVAEWLVAAHRRAVVARRRRWAVAALASSVGLVFVAGRALSAGTCAQTLPQPLVTFCPDEPAMAADVNGNFGAVLNVITTRVGPSNDGGVITANQVVTSAGANPLTLQGNGGTTKVGGTLQLAENSAAVCDLAAQGAVRSRNGVLEYCSNANWTQVLAANPTGATQPCGVLPNGVQVLSAGGYTFQTQCESGWTLIAGLGTDRTLESLRVTPSSNTYLPAAAVRALATAASQVRFVDSGGSATSNSNGMAIQQLRALNAINSLSDANAWTFTGNLSATNFTSSCGTTAIYPDLVHTCGNPTGAHVYANFHTLRSAGSVREVISVWVK